jgi:hypothetical protein
MGVDKTMKETQTGADLRPIDSRIMDQQLTTSKPILSRPTLFDIFLRGDVAEYLESIAIAAVLIAALWATRLL